MVYADLHVHTDHSDGQLSLSAVPAAARRAGVDVVAVTDHDRIHPDLSAPVVAVDAGSGDSEGGGGDRDVDDEAEATWTPIDPADPDDWPAGPGGDRVDPGAGSARGESRGGETAGGGSAADRRVAIVRGIELRVATDDGRVDLLGYGLERTPEVEELVDRIQTDRRERGAAMIARVEDRLGVDLRLDARRGLGRPHVARAVDDHPGVDLDYEGAFRELIGDDGPCFVARNVPDFEEGRRVLGDACGLVSLAHPLRYDDPAAALSLTADLDAVELAYPYGRTVDRSPVEAAVREHDLTPTGGSDAHDDRLGRAGLDRSEFDRVRASLA